MQVTVTQLMPAGAGAVAEAVSRYEILFLGPTVAAYLFIITVILFSSSFHLKTGDGCANIVRGWSMVAGPAVQTLHQNCNLQSCICTVVVPRPAWRARSVTSFSPGSGPFKSS